MPSQGTPLVQFRSGELLQRLQERAQDGQGLGLVASRDLGRYYALVDDALPRLRETLSRDEACAVMDACNGLYMDDGVGARFLWAEVADSDGLDEKWGIDQNALVGKLRGLSLAATMTLADAIGRFWTRPEMETDEGLRRVGLLAP